MKDALLNTSDLVPKTSSSSESIWERFLRILLSRQKLLKTEISLNSFVSFQKNFFQHQSLLRYDNINLSVQNLLISTHVEFLNNRTLKQGYKGKNTDDLIYS